MTSLNIVLAHDLFIETERTMLDTVTIGLTLLLTNLFLSELNVSVLVKWQKQSLHHSLLMFCVTVFQFKVLYKGIAVVGFCCNI